MRHPIAQRRAMFCCLKIPRPTQGTETQARLAVPLPQRGQGASRRPGSAAELGDGTARWSLAGREPGAVPGRWGLGGRAPGRLRQLRSGFAAVRWGGECGGTRGREGKERAGEGAREGERWSARPGPGPPSCPRRGPTGRYAPQAPRVRAPACEHADPARLQRQVAPASEQPLAPRRGDAPSPTSRSRHCFLALGSLGAALPSERGPSPRRFPARCPAFPSRWWQPPCRLGRTPLYSVVLIFYGRHLASSRPHPKPAFPPC